MKVLISGINGFIGSHLKDRLMSANYDVIGIHRNLLIDLELLEKFFSFHSPDYILHLGSYGNHFFQTEENQVFLTNVIGTYNMINASLDINYTTFLNFSTTSHNLEAGTFYGSTKSAGEYLVRAFVNKYNKPILNIRPYSVFGEREWNFRFIPTIIEQIKAGQEITVSDVAHDWIFVEDFIDGIFDLLNRGQEMKGKAIGIGTGKRINNLEIAKTLMKVSGKEVKINKGIKRSYEIANHQQIVEGEKRNDEIHYFHFAKTPLEKALKSVYEYTGERLKRIVN